MGAACFVIGCFLFIIYYTIRQLCFNFSSGLNARPYRWGIHKKTTQALFSNMMLLVGLACLAGPAAILLGVLGGILDILMFSDLLYMRYYKTPLTCSVIVHTSGALRDVKESVWGILAKKDLLYLADMPILPVFAIWLGNITIARAARLCFGAVLTVAGAIWLAAVYYRSNREPYRWNKKRIARDMGIVFFHLSDICRMLCGKALHIKKVPKETLGMVIKQFRKVGKNAFSGICAGSNLIVVQMESMQDYLVGLTVGGKAVTPNLNRLMAENIRFKNMYYQTSVANTSDAELLCNNSLYPAQEKVSCYEYEKNRFYALGERMSEAGYTTGAYHGNQASFWNRSQTYRQFGYQEFVDDSGLDKTDICGMGVSDASLFRQFIEKEAGGFKNGKSFRFIITLSQHHPFGQFANYGFPVGEHEGTIFGNYLKAAHYADSAIGEFIDALKREGIYDNTLLLMYGDHAGLPELYWHNGELRGKNTAQNDVQWLRHQKVAAFLHLPVGAQEKAKSEIPPAVGKVTSQADILPTLCNLLGLDGSCLLGEDMLEENPDAAIILRDGTVIGNGFVHYVKEDFVYDDSGRKKEADAKTLQLVEEAEKRLEASDMVLDYNILKIVKSGGKNDKGQYYCSGI